MERDSKTEGLIHDGFYLVETELAIQCKFIFFFKQTSQVRTTGIANAKNKNHEREAVKRWPGAKLQKPAYPRHLALAR